MGIFQEASRQIQTTSETVNLDQCEENNKEIWRNLRGQLMIWSRKFKKHTEALNTPGCKVFITDATEVRNILT